MAVVSEPFWVNFNSGVSDRNGTTTHTIPFGFTSTSGNELVFVVHGPVTHTNAGWTERVAPVASGELSVFTKTSTGESSFTDTINAANYPVVWAVYELPSGSTWVNGVGANPTANTMSQLTGLPGQEVVVWCAIGMNDPTANTGAPGSATWEGSYVEDAELNIADIGTTDGTFMTIAHRINVTTTTETPTFPTITYPGNVADDRQLVVFAMNVTVLLAAPGVDALGDRYLALGLPLQRTATVAANGATVTAQSWSIISGPESPGTLSTTASVDWTPSAGVGVYVLRFSATNSQGTTTQDITITVVDSPLHSSAMAAMMMGR